MSEDDLAIYMCGEEGEIGISFMMVGAQACGCGHVARTGVA